jgi:hypothetical protein
MSQLLLVVASSTCPESLVRSPLNLSLLLPASALLGESLSWQLLSLVLFAFAVVVVTASTALLLVVAPFQLLLLLQTGLPGSAMTTCSCSEPALQAGANPAAAAVAACGCRW